MKHVKGRALSEIFEFVHTGQEDWSPADVVHGVEGRDAVQEGAALLRAREMRSASA
jgi:hypothetical protein